MGLAAWLQERLPVTGDQLRTDQRAVPNHLKRWWFALGNTPAYLFVVQIVTGILLAFYYVPEPGKAYDSVRYITDEVAFGWFIRGVHKWSSNLMIVAVVLHALRVFITGAYRRPRELNWVIGSAILGVVLLFGFTGYSLVYEQLSYWGTTVGANISSSVPLVGGFMKRMLLGGDVYNERTLSRLYIIHAAIMPALTTALIAVHIAVIRMQGVTELKFEDEPPGKPGYFSFFPDHLYTEIIAGLVLMIVLAALDRPACDARTRRSARRRKSSSPVVLLRHLPLARSSRGRSSSMGFIVFTMYVWPFVDALIRRDPLPGSQRLIIVAVLDHRPDRLGSGRRPLRTRHEPDHEAADHLRAGVLFLASLILVQAMEVVRKRQEAGLSRRTLRCRRRRRGAWSVTRRVAGDRGALAGSTHARKGVACIECHVAAKDADAYSHYGRRLDDRDAAGLRAVSRGGVEELAASHHSKAAGILASLDLLAETVRGRASRSIRTRRIPGVRMRKGKRMASVESVPAVPRQQGGDARGRQDRDDVGVRPAGRAADGGDGRPDRAGSKGKPC